MKKRKNILLLLLAMLLTISLGLAGCEKKPVETAGDKDGKFVVVTSFYPLYVFTENIVQGIDGIELKNLTEPQTGCLHDYQMKPADMIALEKADLFIINGAGMESFLDKVRKTYPDLKIVEASEGIQLLKDAAGIANPHVWVSISNGEKEIENIAKAMAGAFPREKEKLEKNKEDYLKKIDSLRIEMFEGLKKYAGKKIVTFHEAFPYFAEEFALEIAAVVEREPGSEPSAAELAQTIDIVKASGIKSLFAEPQYSSRSAEVISRETGAKVFYLDPFVTGEAGQDKDAYEKVMRNNMEVLKEALE